MRQQLPGPASPAVAGIAATYDRPASNQPTATQPLPTARRAQAHPYSQRPYLPARPLIAGRGLIISAGKMSGLWSGQPNAVNGAGRLYVRGTRALQEYRTA